MEGAEKGEKKGVVWPRPTGLVVSAIMQLLEVFWFRRDVRKGRGGVADCYTALCSWTGWGRRDTEKGGHEDREDIQDGEVGGGFFQLLEAWPSCLPHSAFVLILHFFSGETPL